MGRPKSNATEVRSRMAFVRLREAEWVGLKQLAAALDQPPSRIMRRLIREALTGGPDYFDDGLLELRRMRTELAAIGRNLNQLSRTANQGGVVNGDDVRRVINAGLVQMEAVKGRYDQALETIVKRAVVPLYQEAGLTRRGRAGPSEIPAPKKSA